MKAGACLAVLAFVSVAMAQEQPVIGPSGSVGNAVYITHVTAANSAAGDQLTADMAVLKDLACEAGHAYAKRDIAALERLTADDYVQTDTRGGVLKRAQWLDFVRNRKSELTVDCDSVEVRFYGEAAVVTGGWTYTKIEEGKPTATSRSRWTSVWSKSGGSWKRHAFQNTYVNPNADQAAMTPIR